MEIQVAVQKAELVKKKAEAAEAEWEASQLALMAHDADDWMETIELFTRKEKAPEVFDFYPVGRGARPELAGCALRAVLIRE